MENRYNIVGISDLQYSEHKYHDIDPIFIVIVPNLQPRNGQKNNMYMSEGT